MRLSIGAVAISAAGILALGCGGGGGASVSGTGGGGDTQSGPFSVRSLGPVNTLTMAGQNALVVGFSGSTINHVRFQQPSIGSLTSDEALRSTIITWQSAERGGNGPVFYDYGRQDKLFLAAERPYYVNASLPTISPQFDRVLWSPYYETGQVLTSHLPDGTGKYVVPGGSNATYPRYSPNAQKIAYIKGGEIVVANTSGSSPVTLTNETDSILCLEWRPDGNEILFGTSGGDVKIVPATGGNVVTVYDSTTSLRSVSWANNDRWLAITTASPSYKVVGNRSSWEYGTNVGVDIRTASFSPDGSRMVCAEIIAGVNTVTVREAFDWTSPSPLRVLGTDFYGAPHWSRYLDRKTLLGSGGSYGSTASGFLYSLTDRAFAAFVSFTSPNPASVQMIKGDNSVPSQGILSVTINAPDGLSNLKYQNRLFGTVVSALSVPAEGAIVAFDADDGGIQFILPYADSAPARAKDGSWKGNFLGVYDANGKNLAPNGAQQVTLEKGRATMRM